MNTSIALVSNIVRETEKAIQVEADDRLVWVPKSLVSVDETGVIFAPLWFAKAKRIGCYCYRPCNVG
jgi:hypothetical protein